MYLLDTNIRIYAMKGKYPALTKKLFAVSPSEIAVSSITLAVLEYGCAKSKWGSRSRNVMNMFLSAFALIPFEQIDSVRYGRLRAELEKNGDIIGPYDLQIAAQGLARGLTIVTHNVSEFERVPGLKIEDWTE